MTEECIHAAICNNGLPRSMQDQLDQKDGDYSIILKWRIIGQKLKESFEKKENLKATEAVETSRILKKDKNSEN
jgi:hypothetical protein